MKWDRTTAGTKRSVVTEGDRSLRHCATLHSGFGLLRKIGLWVFLLLFVPCVVLGVETDVPIKPLRKIPHKTTGGIFFWGDVLYFHDWHIQKNVVTGTHRLLDGKAVQRALGTFDECREILDEFQAVEGLLPMSGSVVVIMHGFGSNAIATRHLAEWFRRNKSYDYVFNLAYPSTMQSILDHARMLGQVIDNLPPTVTRIDFVGHSLGSIVMRRYLSGPLDDDWQVPEDRLEARKQFCPDKRAGRFVMLGPPNNGAEVAAKLIGKDPLRRRFAGKSGDELGIHWKETERSLGIPCCPFAIISGGRGDDKGYSTIIPGDDDGMVATEGTKLDGAEYWIPFHLGHGEMLVSEDVFDAVHTFLKTGMLGNNQQYE